MVIQQHVFNSISVASPICWTVDEFAVSSRHHKICIAPALKKCSRASSRLEINSIQLYSVTTLNPLRLENASSKLSWIIASPDTVSDCRIVLDFFSRVLFNWALLSGVGSSAVLPRTGVLKPLAVSLTLNEIKLSDQRWTFPASRGSFLPPSRERWTTTWIIN